MTNNYYQKIEKAFKNFQKRLVKGTKIFLKIKKILVSANILFDIEIVLKKKKEKKCQYGREQYKNLLEDEYRKNSSRMQETKTS